MFGPFISVLCLLTHFLSYSPLPVFTPKILLQAYDFYPLQPILHTNTTVCFLSHSSEKAQISWSLIVSLLQYDHSSLSLSHVTHHLEFWLPPPSFRVAPFPVFPRSVIGMPNQTVTQVKNLGISLESSLAPPTSKSITNPLTYFHNACPVSTFVLLPIWTLLPFTGPL